MSTDATGKVLAGLKLAERIGQGGMGDVYLARNVRVPTLVRAVKLIRGDFSAQPEFRDRFLREAAVLAQLHSPHVLHVDNVGEEDGLLFIVTELLEGEPLDRLVARSPMGLPFEYACELLDQALVGVAHAHEQKVIHRDLKPANLFLTTAGLVKVIDFGVARDLAGVQTTGTGFAPGTAAYYAPEFLSGAAASQASDQYALGVTLFELLTGRLPFAAGGGTDGQAMMSLLHQHAHVPVPDPRQFQALVPEPLVAVIQRAMAKTPEARFPSALAFADAVRAAASLPPRSQPVRLPLLAASTTSEVKPISGMHPTVTPRSAPGGVLAAEQAAFASTHLTPPLSPAKVEALARPPVNLPPDPEPEPRRRRRRGPWRRALVLGGLAALAWGRFHGKASLPEKPVQGQQEAPAPTFRDAQALERAGKLAEAAEAYLGFFQAQAALAQSPEPEHVEAQRQLQAVGDQALWQAQTLFLRAAKPGQAELAGTLLLQRYPQSIHVPGAMAEQLRIRMEVFDVEGASKALEAIEARHGSLGEVTLKRKIQLLRWQQQDAAAADAVDHAPARLSDAELSDAARWALRGDQPVLARKLAEKALAGLGAAAPPDQLLPALAVRTQLWAREPKPDPAALAQVDEAVRVASGFARHSGAPTPQSVLASEVLLFGGVVRRDAGDLDGARKLWVAAGEASDSTFSAEAMARLSTAPRGATGNAAGPVAANAPLTAEQQARCHDALARAAALGRLDASWAERCRARLAPQGREQFQPLPAMPIRLLYGPDALVAMARSDGARQEAIAAAHAALLLDPKDPSALLAIAEGALLEGRATLALAALGRLGTSGGLPTLLRAQALWVEDGSRREALALLQPILEAQDAPPEALAWAGGLKVLSGDGAGAKALLQRAIDAEPQFAAARLNLGAALLLEDDVEGALDQLQRARALNSAVPELAFDRGLALLQKPDPKLTDEARLQEAQKAFSAYVALGGYRSALVDPALAEVTRQLNALKRK